MPNESNGHIDLDTEFKHLIHHDHKVHRSPEGKQDDIARMGEIAQQARPRVVGAPIGAVAVGNRMQELFKQAQELHKVAEILATALAGPVVAAPLKSQLGPREGQHLFARQMQGLDEVSMMLDSVRQAIERAARSLT